MKTEINVRIQKIYFDRIDEKLSNKNIDLRVARLDENHALASGNKIYKLKPVIECAQAQDITQILSFGGAFSNHIHALAYLAKQHKIESIALIRGESWYAENPTLSDVQKSGMILEFVSRAEYKKRNEASYLAELQSRYPHALIIPEGGSSQLGVKGCSQMARDIAHIIKSDVLCVASGTGATAAGLVCGLLEKQHLNAYSVLKDESLASRIDDFITAEKSQNHQQYSLIEADFGGYSKFDKPLLDFILSWLRQTGILLDPVYTGKMGLRLVQQIENDELEAE